MQMSMEHWWPGTDRGKQKYSKKNRSSQQDYNQPVLHIKVQLPPRKKTAYFHKKDQSENVCTKKIAVYFKKLTERVTKLFANTSVFAEKLWRYRQDLQD